MTEARIDLGRALSATNRQRGQALAEFALAATVTLMLIFGTLEFGRALFTYDLVVNAARLGSRYAIVNGSSCTATGCPADSTAIQTFVRTQSPGITAASLTVTATWPGTGACAASKAPGCPVNVSVSYPFSFVAFSWGSLTMTSSSQMTISQ